MICEVYAWLSSLTVTIVVVLIFSCLTITFNVLRDYRNPESREFEYFMPIFEIGENYLVLFNVDKAKCPPVNHEKIKV